MTNLSIEMILALPKFIINLLIIGRRDPITG